MINSSSPRVQWLPGRIFREIMDPARRFRHANLIHSVRVALGVLTCMILTYALGVPHGQWASITLVIVIGGLQHHGNIRRKAAERAVGTLIGAAVGLAVILQQFYFQLPLLSYFLVIAACSFCAYHAIGKGGYIALLSAITLLIVAGHGQSEMSDGLWRSVEVLIGVAIGVLCSFALPLHATYSWRYTLAQILRGCATTYTAITTQPSFDMVQVQRDMAVQHAQMVQLRALMPSVAQEIRVSKAQLEEVQHSLRICTSLLEILADTRPGVADKDCQEYALRHLGAENRRLRGMLIGMSRALTLGTIIRLKPAGPVSPGPAADSIPSHLGSYVAVTLRLSSHFDLLRQHLAAIAFYWNV